MTDLQGFQKKYLRGLAHGQKPVVLVGQNGVTDAVIRSAEDALDRHELIKVKFIDCKEKAEKTRLAEQIAAGTGSTPAGMIGHVAILYRPHPDPDRRRITLPQKGG